MAFHDNLTPQEVERFTRVDYQDRLPWWPSAAVVSSASAATTAVQVPYEAEAEVAFVVADEYQHHGIGSLLLDELARAACERGIRVFLADFLQENQTREMNRHASFSTRTASGAPTSSVTSWAMQSAPEAVERSAWTDRSGCSTAVLPPPPRRYPTPMW